MESSEDDPELRHNIVQPPSYAEAIRTPLPLPPYSSAEQRSRSPPPPYSEVIGQILLDGQHTSLTSQPLQGAYQSLSSTRNSGWTRPSRNSPSRNRPRHSARASWRTTELHVPRGHVHTDVHENLLQVRRPAHLRLLRQPVQDPRRGELMSVNNKKIIHILAGGLGLLIPLGVIIAMATRETPPEVEMSTKITTPTVYYMEHPGAVDVDVVDSDIEESAGPDVHTSPFRRKRRRK